MDEFIPPDQADARARRGLKLIRDGFEDGRVIFEAGRRHNPGHPHWTRAADIIAQMTALQKELASVAEEEFATYVIRKTPNIP